MSLPITRLMFCAACVAAAPAVLAQESKPVEKSTSTWTLNISNLMSVGNGPRVQGSGNVIEEQRQVGSFRAVRLEGPADVKLRASDTETVVVRADDNIAQLVEIGVENGVLVVNLKKNASFRTKNGLQVLVGFKELNAVAVKGSGDISVDKLQSEKFEASVSGSGDIKIDQLQSANFSASVAGSGDLTVAGTAVKQAISVAGSGNVQAKRLNGKDVKVSVAGSGDVVVSAADTLDVAIAGSGDVTYLGSPKVTRSIAGSGSVNPAK